MATVLHDLVEVNTEQGTLTEIARVLKPAGMLAIVEFKMIEGPPGPPIDIRLSAEEVERLVRPYRLVKEYVVDIGPYNYLAGFTLR
jgi:ubiquinone/menaquinone biosynthesis C-methylase UbiE